MKCPSDWILLSRSCPNFVLNVRDMFTLNYSLSLIFSIHAINTIHKKHIKKKNYESIPVIELHIFLKCCRWTSRKLDSLLKFFLIWKGLALDCNRNYSVISLLKDESKRAVWTTNKSTDRELDWTGNWNVQWRLWSTEDAFRPYFNQWFDLKVILEN